MARSSIHRHPCLYQPQGCTALVECDGAYRRNHDGWPEAVCDVYHLPNGSIDAQPCDDCRETRCEQCGEKVEKGYICGDCFGGTERDFYARGLETAAYPFAENH